jgi:PadR family transcriptional regulator PadR
MYFPIDSLYVAMQICFYRMSIRRYKSTELLPGTLDLLILKTLVHGELHGLAIAHRVEQITNGAFEVKPGSLFPALHSMEEAGWLASVWGESENRRKAKFYRLTKAGRRQLQTETNDWRKASGAITAALRAT